MLFMEDHVVRGNGPTAVSPKLGCLLSGSLPVEQNLNAATTLHVSTHCHTDKCALAQFWE